MFVLLYSLFYDPPLFPPPFDSLFILLFLCIYLILLFLLFSVGIQAATTFCTVTEEGCCKTAETSVV